MRSKLTASTRSKRRSLGGPTLGDVAERAGVSPMTVSRVINGEGAVRAETRAAVNAAIAALDYQPNSAARLLAGAAQCRIALLYSNPSAAYLSEFLVGSLTEASRSDAQLTVEQCDIGASATHVVERLVKRGIDGVVLPPPLSDASTIADMLRPANVPFVAVATGAPPADALSVAIDDAAAAAEMTGYLLALGHRRIGFVLGDPYQTASAARLDGFWQAFSDHGLPADLDLIVQGDFTYRSGLLAAERLLDVPTPPTAIFASNDDMAAAVVAIAHRRGMDVPRDLSVCGFDDTSIATTIWPELTTIRQPVADMAGTAVEMLVAAVKRRRTGEMPSAEHRIVPYGLIRRGSTGAPRPA